MRSSAVPWEVAGSEAVTGNSVMDRGQDPPVLCLQNRYDTTCSVSTPFFAVLACFEDRSRCSCVSSEGLNELASDGSVSGNNARNSFAVSSV